MVRFGKWLGRVGTDIVNGKNLEVYVITVVALLVAVVGLLDDVISIEVQVAVLLAGMAVLVLKSLEAGKQEVNLDDVLRDRQSFGRFADFIRGGSELWVYGPSAVKVADNATDLEREILQRGGKIRFLLQDPTVESSIQMLHQILDNRMAHMLEADITRSESIIRNIQKRSPKIEYRFLKYSPGFSLVIVDPNARNGRAIIEFFGYNNQAIDDRMHIEIHREQSNYWFEYWTKQYEAMWEHARQPEAAAERSTP